MKISEVMAISTVMLVLLGCGSNAMSTGSGGGLGAGAPMFDARGNWQITTQSQSGTTGGAAVAFQENLTNGSVSGTVSNIQPPCATSATLSGNISRNTISFAVNENGQVVNFTGTVTATGTLSGTYSGAAGGCTNGESGNWSATRTSGP
jgi:hypothetical protein